MPLELSADETAVLAVIRQGPRPVDLVQREARLETTHFLRAVMNLQRQRLVRELPGDLLAVGAG